MWSLLFLFPKHIFTEHLYITYHKQYIINIKLIKISIAISATKMILVTNNNININNYNWEKNKRGKKITC